MIDRPYFMENKEWYEFDFVKKKYVLTDKAPDEARISYEQYCKELERMANIERR